MKFRLNDRVRVTQIIDPEFNFGPETMGCVGQVGVVISIDYESNGASEDDPFYMLEFPNGHKDPFWTEELELDTSWQDLREAA